MQDKEISGKTEQAMLDVIKNLRANPEKYRAVRKSIREAKTDEEKVQNLLRYATSDRELVALVPTGTGGTEELAWTTVTVTTVFIPESAY